MFETILTNICSCNIIHSYRTNVLIWNGGWKMSRTKKLGDLLVESGKITNSQLSWFDKISSINIKNKIVFVHSPAFPTGAHLGHCLDLYPDCRDAFIDIVEKNHINLIISGHEHNYSRRIIGTSNIIQIITGGGGEKLHSSLYTYYN